LNGKITIAASLAQKPGQGGHAWVLLQYLLGFRKLGWDVLFLDALDPSMCIDRNGRSCTLEESSNLESFLSVMKAFGLQESFSLDYNRGEKIVGVPRRRVLEHVRDSALLINVMGFLDDEDVLGQARKRVFLDIDPGFGQMWQALGLARLFDGYDHHVTIGMNIGKHDCAIPNCGISWLTTFQPLVLEFWPPVFLAGNSRMTSVVSWRGAYGPVEYQGRSYGLRVHEFRKFLTLPVATRQKFELALSIHPDDARDLELLHANGWGIADPGNCAGDPAAYRAYIQASGSEFMCAKNMYVQSRSGWFSDRSICYLGSGKPVLAQDTGLDSMLPVGEGLLLFETLDQAVAGVEELRADYEKHSRAAREMAEEVFESGKVLGKLLARLGVSA
jgi:hypothetical protein